MKRYLSLLLVLCILIAAAGCGGGATTADSGASPGSAEGAAPAPGGDASESAAPADAAVKDTLTLGVASEPIVNPWLQLGPADIILSRQIYDPIFRDEGNGNFSPCLAESYEWIDDMHIKLTLRKGVKFHDGSELTSKDILYFFDNIADYARYSASFPCYQAGEHEIIDDYNIVIALKYPYVEAAYMMSRFYIPSSAAVEAVGDEAFSSAPVGTGPYRMERWDTGSEIHITRFADYWGSPDGQGPAASENILVKIIPDNANRVIELETGGVDIAYSIGTNNFKRVEETDGISLITGPTHMMKLLILSMKEPLVANKDVRYAMSMALDTQAIIDACYDGYYKRMSGIYSELVYGWKDLGFIPYDVAKAKELMAQAGAADGFKITLLAQENEDKSVAEAIQNMWAQINIQTEIVIMPATNYDAQGNVFQASIERGSAPTLCQTIERYQHNSGSTLQTPSEGRQGDLVKLANSTRDEAERLAYVEELQQLIYDERYIIPLANYIMAFAVSDKVINFEFDAYGAPYLTRTTVLQ